MDNFEVTDSIMNSQKSFQCSVCKKEFSRKFTLDMHLLIHKGLKPHSCNQCGRCFRQKGTLMRHKALHSTTALYQCHLCNKAYRQKNVYSHHLKYTHKVSTNSLDRRKSSGQQGSIENEPHSIPVYSTSNFTPINASNRSLQDVALSDSIELSLSSTRDEDFQPSYRKNPAAKSRYEKVMSQTDSFWRCDFCGIIMKYNFENCTRHAATHDKEYPYQCFGCSSIFFQKSELICHHSQCPAYQGYLQTRLPCNQSLEELSRNVSIYGEMASIGKDSTDVTFTCIPCQQDFQTEEDFECHVKTHVQSVLGDCSNPESPPNLIETKFTPFERSNTHLDYPSSSTMESTEKLTDPYDCGNPYELINTVVAGANSVLNFMSNINGDKARPCVTQPSKYLPPNMKDSSRVGSISSRTTGRFSNSTKQEVATPRNLKNEFPHNLRSKKSEPLSSNTGPKEKSTKSTHILNIVKVKPLVKVKKRVETKLSRKNRFKCKVCKTNFGTMYKRESHQLKHIEFLNFKCTLCNLPFLGKFQLRQHLRHKHSVKYSCSNISCRKSFSYQSLMELHKKTCKGRGNFDFSHVLFPAFAPVIDLSRVSADHEKRILGVIPLKDLDSNDPNCLTKPRYAIPVLSFSSSMKDSLNLPIVGQISLSK